jgi:hypothetical protein
MTNNRRQMTDWLPTTKKEMNLRGWEEADVILFSGDAYIDHPSFGTAVIGRLLEKEGLKVAVVPQPNWRDDGEIILTERIKDLYKTSNGKYIAPQMIETRISEDKYIDQAVKVFPPLYPHVLPHCQTQF